MQEAEYKAMEYFWQHGYTNASLDDLVQHLGVSRSSLYNVWNSKEALFRSAFARYLKTIGMEALKPLGAATGEDPRRARDAVKAVFDIIALQVSHDPYRRGCLMVNTITELSQEAPELARFAHEAAKEVHKMFREALDPLVVAGKRTGTEADADAAFLLTAFMGLRVMARSGPSEEEARAVAKRTIETVFGPGRVRRK